MQPIAVMTNDFPHELPCFSIVLILGLVLFIDSFSKKGRPVPYWARFTIRYTGIITILWALTGLIPHFFAEQLPSSFLHFLRFSHIRLSGAGFAILIFLFLSGAFKASSSTKQTDDIPPKE